MLSTIEDRLIYFPSRYPEGDWQPVDFAFEDVWFQAADGTKLHGWYCPVPVPNPASSGEPPLVLLHAHGNAGNLSDRAGLAAFWQQTLGVDVFLFDYRGYGRSEGRPNERGLLLDGQAAYSALRERGIPAERILLTGQSLGGAVALAIGLEVPHQGLVLESTFTSLPDVARRLYGNLPLHWLMRTRFDNLERIARYEGPLLVLHGGRDSLIPFDHAERLVRRATSAKNPQIHIIGRADHNDMPAVDPIAYVDAYRRFLASLR